MTSSPKSDTSGRSASFHGRLPTNSDVSTAQIKRPESHPELLRRRGAASGNPISIENGSPRLTKLLLNVTIQRSLGPVHVVMSPESTVADLTKAALEMYVKEGRRPLLAETDPESFELHYSPFSLDSKLAIHFWIFIYITIHKNQMHNIYLTTFVLKYIVFIKKKTL